MKIGPLGSCVAVLALLVAAATSLAGVEVEIGNGDKITGTLDPADETEVFRFRVPERAEIAVKAKALKGGPSLDVLLAGPDDDLIDFQSGKSVAITGAVSTQAGLHSVSVSSSDLETTGDYALSVTWKVPTSFTDTYEVVSGDGDILQFAADEGAVVTLSIKSAKGSPAVGALASLTPPDGPDVPLAGAKTKLTIQKSGVYTVAFTNDGDDDGGLVATAKIKPAKLVKRKIALTSRVIGSGNPDGDTAFASVLGKSGGIVTVPAVDEGEPGFELLGSSVDIPPNALSVATAIIIATAPELDPPGGGEGAGTTVFFGPEGTKFEGQGVTVTIPYDAAFDSMTDSLVIYTRDAKGKIHAVLPPYTFDTATHTVSFATSHFSSFRAATQPGSITPSLLTVASGFSDPRDVCLAYEPGSPPQPALYFVAGGFAGTVTALRVSTQPGVFLEKVVWAGGGALTADGSAKEQFDFQGEVVSVYALSDGTVWVATPTRVFRVATDGTVTHVAGTGTSADGGDGGSALQATFVNIRSVIVGPDETVYVADPGAFRIRVIDPATQTISTYAGTGTQGVGQDGIAPNLSQLDQPADMEFADDGGLYVADRVRVRHLTPAGPSSAFVNVTVAGSSSGVAGNSGDGGPLLSARFKSLSGISIYYDTSDPTAAKLVVSDEQDATVRLLDLDGNSVTLVAGVHDTFGNAPDIAPADGLIATPLGLVGLAGQLTFVDAENGKVRTRILLGQ